MKDKLLFLSKFLGFLIVYFIVMTIVDMIFPSNVEVEITAMTIITLIVQILVNSIAIIYLIHRLDLKRMKLILITALTVYGIQIFMTQIETWLFIEAFPMFDKNELLKLFVGGLILFLAISTIAYLFFKPNQKSDSSKTKYIISKSWLWKIPSLSIVYMFLYIAIGIMIAWRSEELRNFYADSVSNMSYIELRIIQIFRGFLWILFTLPILIWLKGKRIEKIISISLMLAILPTILLLFPNPYMPSGVRLTHFVEVFLSNGLFGLILGYVLTMKNKTSAQHAV
jgi:hypothetical protein